MSYHVNLNSFKLYFPCDNSGVVAYSIINGDTSFIDIASNALQSLFATSPFTALEFSDATHLNPEDCQIVLERLTLLQILTRSH